jgi:archaellin
MKRIVFSLFLLSACFTIVTAQQISKSSFAGVRKIELTAASGNVIIVPGTGDDVTVTLVYTYEEGFRPVMKQQGSTLVLKEEFDRGSHDGHSTWTLSVPDNLDIHSNSGSGNFEASKVSVSLNANTGSGNVDLNDVTGEVRLNTGSGNLEVNAFDGTLHTNTGLGNMNVEDSRGDIRLNAGSGSIELKKVNGELQVGVGSGDIEAQEVVLAGQGSFNSGSGDVTVELGETPGYDISINSGSGNATLVLNGNEIDGTVVMIANKRGGRIEAPFDFDHTGEIDDGHGTRIKKSAELGDNNAEVKIGTGSGTASIRKLKYCVHEQSECQCEREKVASTIISGALYPYIPYTPIPYFPVSPKPLRIICSATIS